MATRKRASGGGRKPKGEFSRLDHPFSLRMPADLRKQLEDARKRTGKSFSQEMLTRVKSTFHRERYTSIDPSMRALCYLMSCIQHSLDRQVLFLNNTLSLPAKEERHWRAHPFFYVAFKIAVQTLLDKFEPIGSDGPVSDQTPFEVGSEIANQLWFQLLNTRKYNSLLDEVVDQQKAETDDPASHKELDRLRDRFLDVSYGLDKAKDDLQLRSEDEQQ
jgi:hypothetical protein